jgi:phage terminase small subunit
MASDKKKLTRKQQIFIDEYLRAFNAAAAARIAGYSEASIYEIASRLLTNDNIKAQIEARMIESHMSADEALKLTSDIARGDITELLTPLGSIDLDYIRDNGLGRLIKKVKVRTVTKIGKGDKDDDTEIHDTEIELYDAQAAQRDVLKIAGKYKENVDITTGGEKIKGFAIVNPDDWDKTSG